MASIYFASTYEPVRCGIADYTAFVGQECPEDQWAVLTFRHPNAAAPSGARSGGRLPRVWRGLPGHSSYSATTIGQGVRALARDDENAILWFQHEGGIWRDTDKFVSMLGNLSTPKVVSFHGLHFQSPETPWGLRRQQYDLLRRVLPHTHAVTVFSRGAHRAVTSAFPQHRRAVSVMKHGVHLYPEVSRLGREEARERLNEFLLHETDLDTATKGALHRERVFTDRNAVIIGQTGFFCPLKHSEALYAVRDDLQQIIPHRRIVAVRIGSPREAGHHAYAETLRGQQTADKLLVEVWLPRHLLPLAQRAFDVNLYWPSDCTQSGILAHALGAGAVVAGRELEGIGETLKEAKAIVDTDLQRLLLKMRNLILDPHVRDRTEEAALAYAREFSWPRQARRHLALAQSLAQPVPVAARHSRAGLAERMILPAVGRTGSGLATETYGAD